MTRRIVVVGGDAAGMSAASKAKRIDPEIEVIVLEKGPHISYAACGIPYYIGGVVDDWHKLIVMTPETARDSRGIDVRSFCEAEAVDPVKRAVYGHNLKTGEPFELIYGKLVLATGARPRIPNIEGMDLPGVFTMRSIDDGIAIKEYIETHRPKQAVVVGGGYIGLEMVEAFTRNGIKVTVIEQLDRVMVSVDEEIAKMVEDELKANDVDFLLRTSLSSIKKCKTGGLELFLAGGPGKLTTEMVLISVGVQANAELAKNAGARIGKSGAIRVNEKMETTLPDIYAAGDCAEHKHLISGRNTYIPLAPVANKGGRIAGENAAGGNLEFPGIIGTSITKIFDLEVARTGLSYRDISETVFTKVKQISITEKAKAKYFPGTEDVTINLIAEQRTLRLLGAQILGRSGSGKKIDVFAVAITKGMTLHEISNLDLAYAPPFSPVYDPMIIAANVGTRD